MKKTLCYIAIFVLFILLLLPPALRLFGKDLYESDAPVKKEIQIVNCNKETESFFGSYSNSDPQMLQYKIMGNYMLNSEEENNSSEETNQDENTLLFNMKKYSIVSYDEEKNMTTYEIDSLTYGSLKEYLINLKDADTLDAYLTSQGFSCNKTKY